MKKLSLILFLTLLFTISLAESISACSCMNRDTPCAEFREADLVFVGTVSRIITIKDSDGFSKYKTQFSIEDSFKGTSEKQIDVLTSTQGSACGFHFENYERYLVYAYKDEKSKTFHTSICTRTRPVGLTDDEVDVLASLAKGKLEPRIYGTVYEIVRGIDPLRTTWSEERKPLAGVKVIATKGEKKHEAVTKADGTFSIKGVVKGIYKISFEIPPTHKLGGDYWDENTTTMTEWYKKPEIEITTNNCPDALLIETRVDGRIKGRIFDSKGISVGEDIRVTLVTKSSAKNDVGDIDSIPAYTDKNGYYEFYGIPPGEYLLGFNVDFKPNKNFPYPRTYYPSTNDISKAAVIFLSAGEKLDGFNLYLPNKVPQVSVKGKVIDVNGNPVKGAIVEKYGLYYSDVKDTDPYSMSYIKQPTFEGREVTNDKGEFTLELLQGNKYRLNAFLEKENSNENLLEGDKVDIEVNSEVKFVTIVLNKKPKK